MITGSVLPRVADVMEFSIAMIVRTNCIVTSGAKIFKVKKLLLPFKIHNMLNRCLPCIYLDFPVNNASSAFITTIMSSINTTDLVMSNAVRIFYLQN